MRWIPFVFRCDIKLCAQLLFKNDVRFIISTIYTSLGLVAEIPAVANFRKLAEVKNHIILAPAIDTYLQPIYIILSFTLKCFTIYIFAYSKGIKD